MELRRLLPYTTFALVVACAYTGWTFYSRYSANQDAQQQLQQKEAAADQKTVQQFGGGKLAILSFYASPAKVSSGDRVLVCYSVTNAASVRIEPEIEPVKPSISRCLETHPKRDVVYKLTARDATGAETTAEAAITVR
jgi:hypothetical protein